MFSVTLGRVLDLAEREAQERRHAHLTLEHLLFAIAHDPEGEKILRACGVDLDRLRKDLSSTLDEMERLPRGREQEPSHTLAFRRVLQAAVLHVQAAQREQVKVGDVLAALFQQPRAQAVALLAAQGVTRLDVLNFISHGVSKVPSVAPRGRRVRVGGRSRRRAFGSRARSPRGLRREPDRAGPARRARSPHRPPCRDPARPRGALPAAQEQSGLRGRSRRRQDRPRRGTGPAPSPGRRPRDPQGRGDLRPRQRLPPRGHPLPRRFRGALQGHHGRPREAPQAHPVHRRAAHHDGRRSHHRRHHGPRQPREAHPHRGTDPAHRLHHLRGVQVHREGPCAAPTPAEDRGGRAHLRRHRADPEGPALALRAAPRGHLHRRRPRGRGAAGHPPPARAPASRQRRGRDRRGRRCPAVAAGPPPRKARPLRPRWWWTCPRSSG